MVGEEGGGGLGPQDGKRQKLDRIKIAYMRRKVNFSAAHRLWRWVYKCLTCLCIEQCM